MAFTITYGGSGGAVQWGVLTRLASGALALPLFRAETHTGLRQEGLNEFAVLHPIYRSGDPNCCPTGGYRYRRYGWDGTHFVLRAEEILAEIPRGFY